MFRFLGAAIVAAVVVVTASFVWPAFSVRSRPEALQRVHDAVAGTSVGSSVDRSVTSLLPDNGGLSVGSVAGVAVSHIVESVGESAKEAALRSTVDQVLTQWDSVPEEQKTQIRNTVCK